MFGIFEPGFRFLQRFRFGRTEFYIVEKFVGSSKHNQRETNCEKCEVISDVDIVVPSSELVSV